MNREPIEHLHDFEWVGCGVRLPAYVPNGWSVTAVRHQALALDITCPLRQYHHHFHSHEALNGTRCCTQGCAHVRQGFSACSAVSLYRAFPEGKVVSGRQSGSTMPGKEHRKPKVGRKAEKKTDKKKATLSKEEQRKQNPRAFAFQSAGAAKSQRARSAEKAQKRLHGELFGALRKQAQPWFRPGIDCLCDGFVSSLFSRLVLEQDHLGCTALHHTSVFARMQRTGNCLS